MAEVQPTLEDLRDASRAAWLWDPERARLIWANRPAVSAFDATSLFDLIDRSFDPNESGVARIIEMSRTLERGTAADAALLFPSVGMTQAMSCQCWMHTLADGRSGVLVVQKPDVPKLSAAPDHVASGIVASLPMPVLVLDGEGHIRHGNAAALKLLGPSEHTTLGALIDSQDRAAQLLSRLDGTSIVSSTLHVRGRDLKCVFSRADENTISLMLEDVTERRALEHDMLSRQIMALDAKVAEQRTQEAPAAVQTPAEALETLGKSIEEAVKSKLPPPSLVEAAPEPERPVAVLPRKVPFVPDAIRLSLDRTGQAILIGREGEGLFATTHAAKLLRYDDVAGVFANTSLWSDLFQSGSGATLSLVTGKGNTEAFSSTRATIPWQNGPADQFHRGQTATAGHCCAGGRSKAARAGVG
jgi:PAS domain-containing protein